MVNFKLRVTWYSLFKSACLFWPFLFFGLMVVLLHFLPALTPVLEYNKIEVQQGQYWRIFTGHLLHTNSYHLWLNLAALVLLALLHNKFYSPLLLLAFYIFTAAAVSLGIFLFTPNMLFYVGLSGVLHGLFVLGALFDIKHNDKTGYLLFIGVILKVLHEQIYGATDSLKQLIEADVAINAHLFGMCAGIVFFFLHTLYRIYLAKLHK